MTIFLTSQAVFVLIVYFLQSLWFKYVNDINKRKKWGFKVIVFHSPVEFLIMPCDPQYKIYTQHNMKGLAWHGSHASDSLRDSVLTHDTNRICLCTTQPSYLCKCCITPSWFFWQVHYSFRIQPKCHYSSPYCLYLAPWQRTCCVITELASLLHK